MRPPPLGRGFRAAQKIAFDVMMSLTCITFAPIGKS